MAHTAPTADAADAADAAGPEPSTTDRVTRSVTARNPRRRARPSDADSLNTQAPRRKRSKISADDTCASRRTPAGNGFIAPSKESESAAGDTAPAIGGAVNGHAHPSPPSTDAPPSRASSRHERKAGAPALGADTPLAVRGGKKGPVKRSHLRGDGATTLCHNEVYSVKMLPSTPKELKSERLPYRGSVAGPHALAVTQEKAVVWEYTSCAVASSPRTFAMPFPARPGEPLPFGALVPSGGSTVDVGLVLVSATRGNVVFYESIDCAASFGFFQHRHAGVEGTIALSSYETVANLVSADHAGFVVVLSSGKLIHLTLRDAQGKPRIAHQQLRINGPASTCFFGSFTGLLSSTYRSDLAAVHTRPSSARGRMQAVGLTERAEVLLWDLDWSGHSNFKATVELRNVLIAELRQSAAAESGGHAEHMVALDFAIAAKTGTGKELATPDADQPLYLVILVRTGYPSMHNYSLIDITLRGDRNIEVNRISVIQTYHAPGAEEHNPRLVLPRPGHTAFVAFEDAITLIGTPGLVAHSPEAQLDTSHVHAAPLEETIQLRTDRAFTVQTIYEEHSKGEQASVVTFIQGAGLVRISAIDTSSDPQFKRISIKSKIEQAVFYGTLQQDNIIDFSKQDEKGYHLQDVQNAALALSDQILRTETAFTHFIPASPSSMPHHLATRAKAMQALASHVRRSHPTLPGRMMWRLMWDAERIAAAQQLWLAFQEHINLVSQVKRRSTLLDELCAWFEPRSEAFALRKDLAHEDDVRKFFIGGLHHLERLLKNVAVILRSELNERERSPEDQVKLVLQANQICLLSIQTAYKFRTEHCASYGFNPELIEEGILISPAEYMDVPEFWTSGQSFVRNTVDVANLSGEINKKLYVPERLDADTERMARDVAETNPQLLELWCTQYQECINWYRGQRDPRLQQVASNLADDFEDDRYMQLRRLADVGQAHAGMRLAEKYRDMKTLTDMVIAEDQYLEEMTHNREIDRSAIPALKRELQTKIRQYFYRYGESWSTEFFNKLFSGASSGAKLARAQTEWGEPLTAYLRAHPSRAKLCWINDVTEARDFAHAASVLRQAAEEQETKLWPKKVELSISKLALLAAEETEGPVAIRQSSRDAKEKAATTQEHLTIVRVQEQLYAHIRPDIMASIDREAELQICMQNYSSKVGGYGAFRNLLEQGLDLVLDANALSAEQLIDVLTLMDIKMDDANEDNFMGAEYVKALAVLNAAASMMPSTRFETLLQVIWKRAYLTDDWYELKFTSTTSDSERLAQIRRTALWQTLHHYLDSELGQDPNAYVRIVMPSECLSSACHADDWAHRFANDDLLSPILSDSVKQDEELHTFVVDKNLDEVVERCIADAREFLQTKQRENEAMAEQDPHLKHSFAADEHPNGHAIGYEDVAGHLGPAEESGIEEDEDATEEIEQTPEVEDEHVEVE